MECTVIKLLNDEETKRYSSFIRHKKLRLKPIKIATRLWTGQLMNEDVAMYVLVNKSLSKYYHYQTPVTKPHTRPVYSTNY